jgi:hypothetical protein
MLHAFRLDGGFIEPFASRHISTARAADHFVSVSVTFAADMSYM